ncbi:type II toxin-antitoxin system VapC family toxin [Scytonema sp. NUACC26]|uniref:type II toxin-antitoxin system VapC family toxin n=1 Tax=Scytonema sp. NUACC26 TaxID=3140176 RepID=UPI0034DB9C17
MMMTGFKKIFVDTNVLIFATNSVSPWHLAATETLQTMRETGIELFVSPQVLREYLAAATRLNVTGSELQIEKIWENVNTFRTEFTVLEDNNLVLSALIELLRNFPTAGRQVYDANIVATMQVHNIGHLLTHNVADFSRFSTLIQILPLEVNS